MFLGLGREQQEWLWARYADVLEPADSDAEANRRMAERTGRSPAALAAAVERWRAKAEFIEVEARMRAGLSSADANGLIEHYLAAVAVRAIQELARLIAIPWDEISQAKIADAKARAITMALKAQRDRSSNGGSKVLSIEEVTGAV